MSLKSLHMIKKIVETWRIIHGLLQNASDAEKGWGKTVRVSRAMTSVFPGDTKISEISLRLGIRVDSGRRNGWTGGKEQRRRKYIIIFSCSSRVPVCAPDGTSWMTHQSRKPPACPKRGSAHGIARQTRVLPLLPSILRQVANSLVMREFDIRIS